MDVDLNGDDQSMVIDSMEPEVDEKDVTIINPPQSLDADQVEEVEETPKADDFAAMKMLYLPEDPNLEVVAETTFTWKITNWRKMEQRSHGPIFECDGSPWRILFFPFGNNCECASFYLEQGYGEKPPENWYRCVRFALVLWNPNDPSIYAHHQAHHRFTAEEGDWGFTRFMELRELMNASQKRSRPLVENDSANLTAYVQVIKDPTGVLWHNFINYDSKKETGYVGLKNQGATCYLNSLLQSLFFTNIFRRAVYKIPTEGGEALSNSALALQRLFYLLQTSTDAVGTTELTKSFGWETQDIFAQQDVQELSRILMEALEIKMKGTEVENLLAKLFVGKTKTYIKCIDVDYTSERIEDFWDIQLNVRGFKNLDESFRDYIDVETMDGENKYFAEGHGLQDAKKGVIFESFPEVLHLHLKRFEYDLNTYAMQKVNDHYEFPEEFDASPYLSENADRKESWEYVLHGVLVHSGDLNAGHYYAFLRPEKEGEFFKFDDDRVTRATKRETLQENFGGDYSPGAGNDGARNQYTRSLSFKKSMNAYMLVYLRKSKVDEILVPVTTADAPPHLQRGLDEERALREQRKREREEQHLYLNVRVITNNQFREYQGFDLVNWDDKDQTDATIPKTYKIRKAWTIRELTEHLAQEMQVDQNLVRLWVMVNRQNKTVRPDQPLTELDKTVEDVAMKHSSKANDFRLWAEVVPDPNTANLTREPNSPWIVVFLKCYDPITHTLRGVDNVYMKKADKVSELVPVIHDRMGWSSRTEVKLYEEIKPTMIEPMRPKQSFQQAEIQDGDIICFQRVPTEKELEEINEKKHHADAKEFYDWLVNLINIKFTPRNQPEYAEFDLALSKKISYDELAEMVGTKLNVNPTHLRFTTVNANTGAARAPVKRAPGITLHQMLTNQYYSTTQLSYNNLYYEVLDIPLSELETKRTVKTTWLPEGINKEELVDALVPRSGSVQDIIITLQKKFNFDSSSTKIRFFQAHQGKIHKVLPDTFNVAGIQDFMTLYAEPIPDEELAMADASDSCIIDAFHFHKEPSKPHTQGVPFKFVVKKGEKFEETRKRLQARTGIKGKPFEKIKFAVVKKSSYSKPVYLNDDDVLSDIASEPEDLLGLDHPDKNGRNGWGRSNGPEIRIR